jgi:hypothetical protein
MNTIAAMKLIERNAQGISDSVEIKLGSPKWTDSASRPWLCQIYMSKRMKRPFSVYGEDPLQAVTCAMLFLSSYINDAVNNGHTFEIQEKPGSMLTLEM